MKSLSPLFACALVSTFSNLFTASAPAANPKGQAEHVVMVVWDALRTDFITPQYTPTLYRLATNGVFFKNHHPVYISTPEVHGTALATGVFPSHSGPMANSDDRPGIRPAGPNGPEC